jgi:hypothetical protein
VLDADTGKPIQGATVTLQHALVNTADDGRVFVKCQTVTLKTRFWSRKKVINPNRLSSISSEWETAHSKVEEKKKMK